MAPVSSAAEFYSRLRSSSLYRRGSVAECSARRTHNPAVLRSSPVLTNCCIFVGRAEFKSSPRLKIANGLPPASWGF